MAGLCFALTWSSQLTLLVSSGYLFGGLMFGPDLDIYSRQYQRWGWLRWIWLPYRKLIGHHRSFLSHGPLIGTMVRILYLAVWIGVCSCLGLIAVLGGRYATGHLPNTWQQTLFNTLHRQLQHWQPKLRHYQFEGIALFLGLELGAFCHSICDWLGSALKRLRANG